MTLPFRCGCLCGVTVCALLLARAAAAQGQAPGGLSGNSSGVAPAGPTAPVSYTPMRRPGAVPPAAARPPQQPPAATSQPIPGVRPAPVPAPASPTRQPAPATPAPPAAATYPPAPVMPAPPAAPYPPAPVMPAPPSHTMPARPAAAYPPAPVMPAPPMAPAPPAPALPVPTVTSYPPSLGPPGPTYSPYPPRPSTPAAPATLYVPTPAWPQPPYVPGEGGTGLPTPSYPSQPRSASASTEMVAASAKPASAAARRHTLGLGFDVGAPDGVNVGLVASPAEWLRLAGALGSNTAGLGYRGGLTFVPVGWGPSFTFEVGHCNMAAMNDTLRAVFKSPTWAKPYVQDLGYTYFNGHLGFDYVWGDLTVFLHGGYTYLMGTVRGNQPVEVDAATKTTATVAGEGKIYAHTLSAKLGVVYLFGGL